MSITAKNSGVALRIALFCGALGALIGSMSQSSSSLPSDLRVGRAFGCDGAWKRHLAYGSRQ